MCGIAGYFDASVSDGNLILDLMSRELFHRGPDASGKFIHGGVGLCHRRLSIIDLSEEANQPMYSKCGRYAIIFNGEIYNFKEIKSKINAEFVTNSDTEVILEAFIRFGSDCVNLFNGMFAFVILDKETKVLHLFRDRIGVKPLYYFLKNAKFYFASELKSLLKIKAVRESVSINPEAINSFLHLGYIPQPLSVYSEINKFPAASFATFNGRELQIQKYWNVYEKIKNNKISDLNTAKADLDELLNDSVKLRLISDVPYGVFLSGGIDSALVASVAAKHVPAALNTFTIGFENSKQDESIFAAQIAKRLGANHTTHLLGPVEAIKMILDGMDIFDEPFADSSFLPTMLVSKLAGKNVKMVLSGDGGDELFHGYGVYNWVKRINNPLLKVSRPLLLRLLKLYGNRGRRVAGLLDFPLTGSLRSHLFSQEQYLFSQKEIEKLLKPSKVRSYFVEDESNISNQNISEVEKQALFDLQYYLRDDLLVKVDRASMLYSLECRLPLLDYRIVEYVLNISPSLKIKGNTFKYIEKQLLFDYLPETLFNRPKQGFSIPLKRWLKTDLKYLINDYLNEDVISSTELLNFEYVKKLKDNYLNKNHDYLYNRLWQLIVLQRWMLKYTQGYE